MLDRTKDIAASAQAWLDEFERTLGAPDRAALDHLFLAESYWRDVLALSWNLQTIAGRDSIKRELTTLAAKVAPGSFKIAPNRAPPRWVTRAGTNNIEAIFNFETVLGRGSGIVRLMPDAADGDRLKAWTLLTALDELKGFEEQIGTSRPRGQAYSRDFRGPNWLDLRNASRDYTNRDPVVLVVGGGQAGLAIAARLKQLGSRHPDRRSRGADRGQLAQALSRADPA
ncbi:hypothetical protein ACVWYI_007696 [Bradyrhizobium sp. LB13.1]